MTTFFTCCSFTVAAKYLGHAKEVPYFLERSKNYRNIWNPVTQFMHARYANGSWCDDKSTWTEATNWIYTFNVQHDFAGKMKLFFCFIV